MRDTRLSPHKGLDAKQHAFKVRRCREEDITEVIKLNYENLPENYPKSFFEHILRNWPDTFLVAEMDGKVVGYIMCRIERAREGLKLVKKGHVVSIAVDPKARRMKIGTTLMQEAEKAMKQHGVREMYLEVRVTNDPAIRLYHKLGYKIRDKIVGYYADGEDAWVMVKKLQA